MENYLNCQRPKLKELQILKKIFQQWYLHKENPRFQVTEIRTSLPQINHLIAVEKRKFSLNEKKVKNPDMINVKIFRIGFDKRESNWNRIDFTQRKMRRKRKIVQKLFAKST